MQNNISELYIGIDVGSTTVKIAVTGSDGTIHHCDYRRHNAEQSHAVKALLDEAHARFPGVPFSVAMCGSGAGQIAERIGAFFVQEVVANAIAVKEFYPSTRTAIELGGQDAKVVFFSRNEATGELIASDMRMNGACAGGTGAFIDQVAELLGVTADAFGALAERGSTVYEISGRCGVFAKTDIQPLLNQGVSREDIALSAFHAIAKQTIGGLAQGMEIVPPVIFEGGPLTFNPALVRVFTERLAITADEAIVPARAEIIVAHGAALSIRTLFAGKTCGYDREHAARALSASLDTGACRDSLRYFADAADQAQFIHRHTPPAVTSKAVPVNGIVDAYIGIDAGSTTSKFVLMDADEKIIETFYAGNNGDPLTIIRRALIDIRDRYRQAGITLRISGVGTTGYGELLFHAAFKADHHTVETVAHAAAATRFAPEVSFILDIGGQDMKAITLRNGVVSNITLNEACSAGCGSFLETYARSLGVAVTDIARLAFASDAPSHLGSRCTVFMNSSIITEQKNGKSTADIMAGLCRSIIENVFTKVVRTSNFAQLGDVVMVQGGTFKNDAVLRAMEQYTGRRIVRAPIPGEMGAYGIALLTKRAMTDRAGAGQDRSSFIGLDALDDLSFEKTAGDICPFCANSCARTVITFNDGSRFVTGNRCERGAVIGDPEDEAVRSAVRAAHEASSRVPDLMKQRHALYLRSEEKDPSAGMTIGIPRVLEFWNSLPFWRRLFSLLGFRVVLSPPSSYRLFNDGLKFIPSDTVCFPAKLAHGHIESLAAKKVDRIFMPMMLKIPHAAGEKDIVHTCAVVQGYPVVIDQSHGLSAKYNIPFDTPAFHWYNKSLRDTQIIGFFQSTFGIPAQKVRSALTAVDEAVADMHDTLRAEGARVLDAIENTDRFAVILAGRPYHTDPLVNHGISSLFTAQGVPVLTIDSLPGLEDEDLSVTRAETVNAFHTHMFEAALKGARHPNLEVVQLVSFGCGHDAVISDEMERILREVGGKELLVLKLDEGENKGPLSIRIKSFVETVRTRRKAMRARHAGGAPARIPKPFGVTFEKNDRDSRTIMVPNLSWAFCQISSGVLSREGYSVRAMDMADDRAKELGKRYVHNDICYPAQINIGEALAALERGVVDPAKAAVILAKNCNDCRAGQYSALARKALDDAGYASVPIVTTGADTKGIHKGFTVSPMFQLRLLWGIAITDALQDMLSKTRPYEREVGATDRVYRNAVLSVASAIKTSHAKALRALADAVDAFNSIPVDRAVRRPQVFVIGEILLNYHPSSNNEMVRYLEKNGMETMLPSMVDFFRRDLIRVKDGISRDHIPNPLISAFVADMTDRFYEHVVAAVERIAGSFRFHEPAADIHRLASNIDGFIDRTFMVGEGWLIPAEIIEHAQKGVDSFIIVQPFGCLPNHITGRGLIKPLKKRFPHIQILSLDFDPDSSFANIENRLQMLIMNAQRRAALSSVI